MRTGARLGLAVILALLASGCGDPALWARWRCDAALFRAESLQRRVLARGPAARPADLDRLERRLRAILEQWPAAEWATRERAHGPARDVALGSARAALMLADLASRRGRDAEAVELRARIEREDEVLPEVVVTARVARIAALERLGRFDEALAERQALADMDPLGDPERPAPVLAVLSAPLELAVRLRDAGREADANASLANAEARFASALGHAHEDTLGYVADALSQVRAERGDVAGSLAALRLALVRAPAWLRPLIVEELAARALEAGAPESVFAYSRWAAGASDTRRVAGQAWLVAAQAWERLGQPDSALANYDAVLGRWNDPGSLGPVARMRRAGLLERLGQWDRARAEYLALGAAYPSDPMAFLAAQRIVQYHLRRGEPELARVAGEGEIANLDRLLAYNRDPQVQRGARAVRADLLVALGRLPEAEAALLEEWRLAPEDSTAQDAALRAAQLAAHRPGGGARADSVAGELRRRATSATVRRAAGALLGGAPR